MTTFKNKQFTKRDYEATNIVFCRAESNPKEENWIEVSSEELEKSTCNHLFTQEGVQFFGWH
jgi:hypothetical protein